MYFIKVQETDLKFDVIGMTEENTRISKTIYLYLDLHSLQISQLEENDLDIALYKYDDIIGFAEQVSTHGFIKFDHYREDGIGVFKLMSLAFSNYRNLECFRNEMIDSPLLERQYNNIDKEKIQSMIKEVLEECL